MKNSFDCSQKSDVQHQCTYKNFYEIKSQQIEPFEVYKDPKKNMKQQNDITIR